jgi:hypothetical protein
LVVEDLFIIGIFSSGSVEIELISFLVVLVAVTESAQITFSS